MSFREMRNEVLSARVIKGLESRNMEGHYVKTKEEAVKKALELMPKGSTLSWGGTQSISECGLKDAVYGADYILYDRDVVDSPEEKRQIMLKAFDCDFYIGSVNAMTEDGVFVNVDGNANRVAAYAYGPRNLLLVVGMNKIVKTEADALSRARNEAAPINTQRLGIKAPCVEKGTCFDCKSSDCICCQIMTTRFSRIPKRVKVILVDEELGF